MTAVHGSQLNKPGLGSSTLRKNGSRIVPRNLSQANASLFRNIRVGGSWGSQSTQIANFQALRFSANPSGAAPRAMGIFGGSYNVADNLKIQNGSNSFYAGQVVGQGISMALGILNQFGIIGNNKAQPQGAAAQLDNALGGVPTATSLSSSSANAALDGMTQATTASNLSRAIATAEGEYNTMQSQDGTLKAEADKAQANMKTLQDNVSKEQANVERLSNSVADGEQQVNGLNAQLQKLDAGYAAACQTVDTKQTMLDNATKSYNDAESKLNNTPETLENGQPNPAYAEAKAQFDAAKAAKEKAEKELGTAKKEKEEAFNKLEDKQNEVKEAEDKLNKAKDNVKAAKEGLEEAKKKQEEAKKALDDANGAIKKYQDNAKDMQILKSAIDSHKERLEKLKQKEQKEILSLKEKIQKNDAKIAEMQRNIDNSDGYSKGETKNMDKINKLNTENLEYKTRLAELESAKVN